MSWASIKKESERKAETVITWTVKWINKSMEDYET